MFWQSFPIEEILATNYLVMCITYKMNTHKRAYKPMTFYLNSNNK